MAKQKLAFLIVALILLMPWAFAQRAGNSAGTGPIYVATFDGPVDVPRTDYLKRVLKKAATDGARMVVVKLNTPGGSLSSTQQIVQAISESTVPVGVYVSPSGGWAGSAGVFITMTSHVAAMAPGTTIGSAHPVSGGGDDIEGDMRDKVTNMTAAWGRTIAEQRGRNADWAEQAVRKSIATGEQEAVKKRVVDFVAQDITDFLRQADGRKVKMPGGKSITLQTAGAAVTPIDMTSSEKLLAFLVNPYMLLLLGSIAFIGIVAELQNPGAVFPGTVGAIALLLLLYGGSFVAVNIVGIALIVLAVALFIIDVYATSHGVLTVGGIVSLFLGLTMVFPTDFGAPQMSLWFILPMTIIISAGFLALTGLGLKAQLRPKETGVESMVGRLAEAREALNPSGRVFMDGTLWAAETVSEPIAAGTQVRVARVEGLKLLVEPLEPRTTHLPPMPEAGSREV